MKKIKIMGGEEIIISDEEANKIMSVVETSKFVALKSGNFINVSSISSITEFKGIPMFNNCEVFAQDNGVKYIIAKNWDSGRTEKKLLSISEESDIEFVSPEEKEDKLVQLQERKALQLENPQIVWKEKLTPEDRKKGQEKLKELKEKLKY